MRATELLDTNIGADCQSTMHKARYLAVLAGVEAAIAGECVTVTALGRAVAGTATEKSRIRRMDALVGNKQLWTELDVFYAVMTRWLIGTLLHPLIIVDWSPLTADEKWHVLRASLPMGGRTLTLYEEVHPQENYGAPGVHRQFLENLKRLLLESCRPIIVTDAGFKNPWFRAVEAQGWDWIGRVRGQAQLSREGEDFWLGCKDLGRLLETNKPVYLGEFLLTRSSPLRCHAFGLRKPPKGRIHKTVRGKRAQSSSSREHAASAREPWILVTSLPGGTAILPQVIAAYRKRMQIEEGFRDTKSEYYGLGLERSGTRCCNRFGVLLVLAALALFAIWLVGKVAQMRGLHREYQANTERRRTVLSCIFLGLRVIDREPKPIVPTDEELRLISEELRAVAEF